MVLHNGVPGFEPTVGEDHKSSYAGNAAVLEANCLELLISELVNRL